MAFQDVAASFLRFPQILCL